MSYIKYVLILSHTVFRKIFGLFWFYMIIPFRAWSRNSMYNYLLANQIYLERLYERPIVELDDRWIIKPYHNTNGGYIKKRKVSYIEYQFNLWFVWGWLDDDANHDTFDWFHCVNNRDRFPLNILCKDIGLEPFYGNSFDLGDVRAENKSFRFLPALVWNNRNTAYNFKYFLYEISEQEWNDKKPFFKVIKGLAFGWVPFDNKVKDKGEQGRLVFAEDINSIF